MKWLRAIAAYFTKTKTDKPPMVDENQSPPDVNANEPVKPSTIEYYVKGSLKYIEEGLKLVGNKEVAGSKDNPVYTQIYIDVSGKAMHDEVANCMYFVQAMLKRGGYKWINTGWAADAEKKFKGWLINKDLINVAVGDVVTKLSTVANSNRHVFFVIAVDRRNKRVLVLEANSGNMIKDTNWYPFDILRSCGTPIKA